MTSVYLTLTSSLVEVLDMVGIAPDGKVRVLRARELGLGLGLVYLTLQGWDLEL